MSPNLLEGGESNIAAARAANAVPGSTARTDIPAKFIDPATGELRIEALLSSYLELERKLSGAGAGVPASPEAYSLKVAHPALGPDAAVNKRLHAAGFSDAQAQLVYDLAADHVLPRMTELAAEFEYQRQLEKLHGQYGGPDRWREVARSLGAWGRANLPPHVFDALAGTSEGVQAIQAMMQKGEPGLGQSGAEPTGLPNEAELTRMMMDKRYWKQRDPAFIAKVAEGFRRIYPG